jgi:uncharacterized protein DUF4071
MPKTLCFVLMPFGQKPGVGGAVIDFDAVYRDLIKPAVDAADLTPLRADEEQAGGIIHKPMFERLILCDFAVADLTTANANVFYELGVRHAVKPATTVLLFAADGTRLPFDLAPLRTLRYQLAADGKPGDVAADGAALTKLLAEIKVGDVDSPVYQLVDGFPDIQHIKTDVFRDKVEYSARIKDELAAARNQTGDARLVAIRAIEQQLGALERSEAGVLVDLLLSYRAASEWKEMIRLARAMPEPLRRPTRASASSFRSCVTRSSDRVRQAGLLGPRHYARACRARAGRERCHGRARQDRRGHPRAVGAEGDRAQPAAHPRSARGASRGAALGDGDREGA